MGQHTNRKTGHAMNEQNKISGCVCSACCLLRFMSPLLAHSVISLHRTSSVAIGGTADMTGRVASAKSVAIDPSETLPSQICCDAQRGVSSPVW
jgi:hypothetical protein